MISFCPHQVKTYLSFINTINIAIVANVGEAEGSLQLNFTLFLSIFSVVAIIVALQTTVVFLIVIFIACKYRRTNVTTPSGSSTAETPLKMENQVYEVVETERAPNPPNHRYGNGKEKFKKNISYGLQHK